MKNKVYEGSDKEGVKWVKIGNFTKNAIEDFEKDLANKKSSKQNF